MKVFLVLLVVGLASALPAKLPTIETDETEYDNYEYIEPVYQPMPFAFKYNIADELMGVRQAHVQESDGQVVTGSYSYIRPDGILMTVRYTADENGFHPVIEEKLAPGLVDMDPEGGSSFSIKLPDAEEFEVELTNQEYLVIKDRLALQKAEEQARSRARQQKLLRRREGAAEIEE